MFKKINTIANSRLLKRVALNADAIAKKFIEMYVKSQQNKDRIKEFIHKNVKASYGGNETKVLYEDQFVGTISCQFAKASGESTIDLFYANDFNKFINNATNIKKDLSFKDRFKSFFSDNQKKKIKEEVFKAVNTNLTDDLFYEYGSYVAFYAISRGLNNNVSREEQCLLNQESMSKIHKVEKVTFNKTSKGIRIEAIVPIFKININDKNYLRKQTQLTQEQLNKIYSQEFQKILNRWIIYDPTYFNQIKDYLINNVKEVAKKMQYEKMNGNNQSIN